MSTAGNNPNTRFKIVTALSGFTPSLSHDLMTIDGDIANVPTGQIVSMTAQAAVAGVNGVYTSTSEGTPVVGEVYRMFVTCPVLRAQSDPLTWPVEVTATTTSFTDLADLLVIQINNQAAGNINPLPGTASNSGGHFRLTEAPYSNYHAGGLPLTMSALQAASTGVNLVTAANMNAVTTATVYPVGDYESVQRIYLANSNAATSSSTPSQNTHWVGSNVPTSTSTYLTCTFQFYGAAGNPNRNTGFTSWRVYYDVAGLGTNPLAYVSTTWSNYLGNIGLGVGAAVTVTPSATSASGAAIIPLGATTVSVAGNASNFVGLPASAPIGYSVDIVGNGTAYKLIMGAAETINGGTAGVGSALAPASCNCTIKKVSTTAWLATAQLISGAGTVTAFPANS